MDTTERAMVPGMHPVDGLRHFLLGQSPELVLEFSKYIHLGLGRTLSREIFEVEASHVSPVWLAEQIRDLSHQQELALHSKVLQKDRTYHIPMVDFGRVESIKTLLVKTQPIRESLSINITLYDSGQSMHGYYFCLIDQKEWYKYLGRLLLCDPPFGGEEQIINSRWVGHSLEHGFSALRWSCNSPIYQSLPQLVDATSAESGDRDVSLTLS
jgi:hypothetical protein